MSRFPDSGMLKRGPDACPVRQVPAAEIEVAVIDQRRGPFHEQSLPRRVRLRRDPLRDLG
jgi:hypothetical protein